MRPSACFRKVVSLQLCSLDRTGYANLLPSLRNPRFLIPPQPLQHQTPNLPRNPQLRLLGKLHLVLQPQPLRP